MNSGISGVVHFGSLQCILVKGYDFENSYFLYIFFLLANPDHVAARSLRSLRRNNHINNNNKKKRNKVSTALASIRLPLEWSASSL